MRKVEQTTHDRSNHHRTQSAQQWRTVIKQILPLWMNGRHESNCRAFQRISNDPSELKQFGSLGSIENMRRFNCKIIHGDTKWVRYCFTGSPKHTSTICVQSFHLFHFPWISFFSTCFLAVSTSDFIVSIYGWAWATRRGWKWWRS